MKDWRDQLAAAWQVSHPASPAAEPLPTKPPLECYPVEANVNDFAITLRLDTPLLQSGALAKKVDPSYQLRGPSVRGLLHTWARALLGPPLKNDTEAVRKKEAELLGLAGDGEGGRRTFRIETVGDLPPDRSFANCPHKPGPKGTRPGHPATGTVTLWVRPHPCVASDPCFLAMLWVVVWTAFSLGAIGNRSRRGYGSLTIVGAPKAPSLTRLVKDAEQLPTFPNPPATADALGKELRRGVDLALQCTAAWLDVSTTAAPPARTGIFPFFELASLDQIYLGNPKGTNDDGDFVMQGLMTACSGVAGSLGFVAGSKRLASPLWVRIYKLAGSTYVPVATLAHSTSSQLTAAETVLRAIGAENPVPAGSPPSWRSLDTF